MTGKKEGSAEADARPGEEQGPKRPYATLDLKATEVKGANPEPKAPAAGPAGATRQDTRSEKKTASPDSPEGITGAAPQEPDGGEDIEGPANTGGKLKFGLGAMPFLTHVAAGLVGGFLALLLADSLSSRLAPEFDSPATSLHGSEATGQIEKRLTVIEERFGQEAARVSSAGEKQQARIDDLARRVGALGDSQAKLEAASKAQADSARQAAGNDERLSKLEQRLAALTAVTGNDPQKGGFPQIAAVASKLADVETAVANQLATLKKSVGEQIDSRLAQASEASEAVRSGTQRMDRDVASLKADGGRLGQRLDALKADSDRLTETIRTVKEGETQLRGAVDAMRGDFDARLKTAAKAADITAAVQPVTGKITAIEQDLQALARSEESRRANAERIILLLELANLKRIVDRGERYAPELAELRKTAAGKVELGALERYRDDGVPTLAELQRTFRPVIQATLDAQAEPVDGSVIDRLIAGAKSVVRVRKVSHAADDATTDAVLGRMEAALKEGRLGEVLEEAKMLPPKAAGPAQDWLSTVEARFAADRAISGIEAQLKASLSGAPPPAGKVVK